MQQPTPKSLAQLSQVEEDESNPTVLFLEVKTELGTELLHFRRNDNVAKVFKDTMMQGGYRMESQVMVDSIVSAIQKKIMDANPGVFRTFE